MYNAQTTKERIKLLCKLKKINMENMLSECSLGVNAIRQINDTKGIASFSLAKIADYLNCSIDYLLGRSDIVENNRLSKDEQDMINRFRRLTPGGQEYILNTLDMALTKYQKGRPFEKEEEYSVAAYGAAETEDTQPPVPEINTLP